MPIPPIIYLREAIKAIPGMEYALGVIGIVSVIVIIKGFGIDYRAAIFGPIIVIAFMFILVIFVRFALVDPSKSVFGLNVHFIGLSLAWIITAVFSFVLFMLVTIFFFSWPHSAKSYLTGVDLTTVTISGKVIDTMGKPIIDAEITIDGYPFHTRSRYQGEFKSELSGVRLGHVITIRIFHAGFKSYSANLSLSNSTEVSPIVLEPIKIE